MFTTLFLRKLFCLGTPLLSALWLGACGQGSVSSSADIAAAPKENNAVTKPDVAALAAPASRLVKQAGVGAVTGFGSVIVEGVKYEDGSAVVLLDTDPTLPVAGTLKDIKLGMRLAVKAQGQQAQSFTLSAEVIGRVSAIGPDGVTVAGQQVRASADAAAPTVFEGLAGLSALAIGDLIEVHGQRDASGAIVASRIERKDGSAAVITRVVGQVGSLNIDTRSFVIGGLIVSWAQAQRLLPSAAALRDGARVAVFANGTPSGTTLEALAIKVIEAGTDLNGLLRVGGQVRDFDPGTQSFQLDAFSVDASKASFLGGSAAELGNGQRVRVSGTFADGKLAASEISFVKDLGDPSADIKGAITDVSGAASFKVRGVPIDASAPDISFVGGDASMLVAGAVVRIKGVVQGESVKPVSIEFIAAAPSLPAVPANESSGAGRPLTRQVPVMPVALGSPGRVLSGKGPIAGQ